MSAVAGDMQNSRIDLKRLLNFVKQLLRNTIILTVFCLGTVCLRIVVVIVKLKGINARISY